MYYYLHKKLDDNYDVISALERQLIVETADREKAETEYNRQIDELEHRREEELAPLREKVITMEEQVGGGELRQAKGSKDVCNGEVLHIPRCIKPTTCEEGTSIIAVCGWGIVRLGRATEVGRTPPKPSHKMMQ